MTRRDYVLLANAIGLALDDIEEMSLRDFENVATVIISRIANALESDNPRFDHKRFTRACVMTPKCQEQNRRWLNSALTA